METEKNDKGAHVCHFGGGICQHGACGCGEHHKHILKGFLKLAILVIIFSFAFQMGELKGMLQSERAHGNMMYGEHGQQMMYRGMDNSYGTPSTMPMQQ